MIQKRVEEIHPFCIPNRDYHSGSPFWIDRNYYRPPPPFLLHPDLRNVLQGVHF